MPVTATKYSSRRRFCDLQIPFFLWSFLLDNLFPILGILRLRKSLLAIPATEEFVDLMVTCLFLKDTDIRYLVLMARGGVSVTNGQMGT